MEAVAIGWWLAEPSAHPDGDTGQEGAATNPPQSPKVTDGDLLPACNCIGERLGICRCRQNIPATSLVFASHMLGLTTWS